jgi:predicted transcriptional regulator
MKKGSKNVTSNNDFYSAVLQALKSQGSNLKKIQEKTGLNKQKLNYYLRQLEKKGCIYKVSKGYYEVKHLDLEHAFSLNQKECRGHAFIWTIKIPKELQKTLKLRLEKRNIPYSLIRRYTPRIMLNNRKVWIGKKTITIYESHSFYGRNAIESRKYAVFDLLEIIKSLELKLEINLKPYVFKPTREHYGLIKNDLAIQCNRNGEKIYIRDNLEGEWLWIDDSESLGELETGGTKALVRNVQLQKWWNKKKENNFEIDDDYIKENMKKLKDQVKILSEQNLSLSKVLEEMNVNIARLTKNQIDYFK